jgi:hypothetical protein
MAFPKIENSFHKKSPGSGASLFLTPLLVCSFEMCAGVPTIEMKILQRLLVRYNTKLCCMPTMLAESKGLSNMLNEIIFKKKPRTLGLHFYKNYLGYFLLPASFLFFRKKFFQKLYLFLPVRFSAGAENIMKPKLWFVIISNLPGVPGAMCL